MSDAERPSIVDPVESQRLQAAYESYLKERGKPWRLVGRYEEAIRQIGDVLDMKLPATAKLAMVRERVALARNIEKEEIS